MKHTLPALGLAVAFAAAPAGAGTHTVEHVSIVKTDGISWATGNIGDAYNSISSVEMLYCAARGYEGGYFVGYCYARNQAGETLQCLTDAPEVLQMILGIHQDSNVAFYVDKYLGSCESVHVGNGSPTPPKRAPTSDQDTSAIDQSQLEVKQ